MRREGDFIHINECLLPLSWLYGLTVCFRNLLFEMGVLKQHSFRIPIISVGNITVGGTGKTPHVEYLIKLLKGDMQVSVLSRGYKRRSRGYVLATENTEVRDIGDEPYQMKRKFPSVYVAVDRKRTHGITRLTNDEQTRDVGIILLDDAYQHRYVKPGINILLVDYHRLIIYDKLLPAGRLREPLNGKDRADMVIITKCPKDLKPMEFRVLTKTMNLYPYQDLFFTSLNYGALQPIFGDQPVELASLSGYNVLLLTGIASPEQMIHDLKPFKIHLTMMTFGDHHRFTKKEIEQINSKFAAMPLPKIIITTEKDAARLYHVKGLSNEVQQHIYVLPVSIKFMLNREKEFNSKIISYVRKNSRDGILAENKDDNASKDGDHIGNRAWTTCF